jgi:uncharacterized membrane-anchored protein
MKPVLVALVVVCAVQWAVPAWLIHRGTTALEQGTQYRFRTAPIDPVDPFRGRYVTLDFAAARIVLDGAQRSYAHGERVYAPITVGEDGFAVLGAPLHEHPDAGDYVEARVQWSSAEELRLALPFDRYYMDERLAPEAERIYRERNRQGRFGEEPEDLRRPAYVTVRVRKGYAVLEELYIDGAPVHELLRSLASGITAS